MVSVCVVGGGTAGSEAASEASLRGAEVTVVERLERPSPGWKTWPNLIRVLSQDSEAEFSTWPAGAPQDRKVVAEVLSARSGSVKTSAGTLRPDFVVLATGSSFEPPTFQGHRKPGVTVLDSCRSYEELGRQSPSMSRIVVAGEGRRSLEVAERLSGPGRRVRVFVSHWRHGRPSSLIASAISSAASGMGVSIEEGHITRALGAGKLEAVVADGTVIPCDALIFIPRRVPRSIPTQAAMGPLGGALVDRGLRTGAPAILAAGGCAELEGASPPHTFEGEPSLSGRVAGSNCVRGGLSMTPMKLRESVAFGLTWSMVELGQMPAPIGATRFAKVGRRWGSSSACELVFETSTKRVTRIESVQRSSSAGLGRLLLPPDPTLQSLAYCGWGSSDISLVSETARLGLRSGKGANL